MYIEATQLLNDFDFMQDFCSKCSRCKDPHFNDVCSPDEEELCIKHKLFEKVCDIVDDMNCQIQNLLMNNK